MSSRPRHIVVFAIFASLLLVSASTGAAAASDGLAVASQHSTETEFQQGDLTNLTIEGSGNSASIVYGGVSGWSDGFEDGDLSEWSGSDRYQVTNNLSAEGSHALEYPGGSASNHYLTRSLTNHTPKEASFYFRLDSHSSGEYIRPQFILGGDTGNETLMVAVDDGSRTGDAGSFMFYNGSDYIDTRIDVSLESFYQVKLTNISYSTHTYDIAVFDASGNRLGSYSGATFWHDIESAKEFRFLGYDNAFYADLVQVGGKPSQALYLSANHSVSNAQKTRINVTETSNISADLTAEYYDGSSWVDAASTTVTNAGIHNLSLPSVSSSTWRVRVHVDKTGSNPQFSLASEAILFDARAPSASNLQPPGGSTLEDRTVNFSVDVADPDFGTAQGDTVEATLFVDNKSVGSKTVGSNQTVSIQHTLGDGGSHSYHWVLTDSYGETTTTSTKTVYAPSTLYVYNESAPTKLVDNVTVTVRFFFENQGDLIVTRNVSDGTLNMTGLPADESFIVTAQGEKYVDRRIYVPSLYETQQVYLLPKSATSVETIFTLEDYTGKFPSENTVLLVQRPLNETWRTVMGDYFGATGQFPAQLAYNVRHRLVLLNTQTGERRILGTYTPLTARTLQVTVTPDGTIVEQAQKPTADIRPQLRRVPAINDSSFSVALDNRTVEVNSWTIKATANNTTLWNTTVQNAGTVSGSLDLGPYAGESLEVAVTYTTDSGTFRANNATYTIMPSPGNDMSLIDGLHDLGNLAPSDTRESFTGFLAILVTIFGIAGVATQLPISGEGAGMVGVLFLTGFAVIGWVGYGLVFVSGVGVVSFAALRRGL